MSEDPSPKGLRDRGIIQRKLSDGRIVWYARIVRTDGSGKKKQFLRKADNKSHARRLRDDLERKFDERGQSSIDGDKLTFRRFAGIYKEQRVFAAEYHTSNGVETKVAGLRSLAPVISYLSVLIDHFGNIPLSEISHSDVEAFRLMRLRTPSKRGPRSVADVNRNLALLRAMMKFAVQNGWICQSPFDRGRSLISLSDEVRRERVMTDAEEKAFLSACESVRLVCYQRNGDPVTARVQRGRELLKAIVITALDTTMRRGELLSLRWSDIDFESGVITIAARNTKTSSSRMVGMTDRVTAELTLLWDLSLKHRGSLVFGVSDFKKSFISTCRDAGIEGLKFHDLRHTAITRMVEAGIPAAEIMKVSGHTQWSTFARYVNPGVESVKRIADAITRRRDVASSKISVKQVD